MVIRAENVLIGLTKNKQTNKQTKERESSIALPASPRSFTFYVSLLLLLFFVCLSFVKETPGGNVETVQYFYLQASGGCSVDIYTREILLLLSFF